MRKKIWPLVLNIGLNRDDPIDDELTEEIKHHQYYNQVVLDVKRILKRFPPGIKLKSTNNAKIYAQFLVKLLTGIDEIIQSDLQVKVTDLIIRVLIANEGLHYYQVCADFIYYRFNV